MIEMGMEFTDLTDFLDEKCIHEENAELVLDYLNDPSYMNPLKANFRQQANPHAQIQAQGYNYVPDARLAGQRGNDSGLPPMPLQQQMQIQ
mmetsp:Transcript_18613/g.25085  ORF Transcript_18613/g.25085 Transcript_18613/m.25085 type:complete len:91 (+) Transcript_18613:812-1084(+)